MLFIELFSEAQCLLINEIKFNLDWRASRLLTGTTDEDHLGIFNRDGGQCTFSRALIKGYSCVTVKVDLGLGVPKFTLEEVKRRVDLVRNAFGDCNCGLVWKPNDYVK